MQLQKKSSNFYFFIFGNVLNLLDIGSTLIALKRGYVELNPFMNHLIRIGDLAFIFFKSGVVAMCFYILFAAKNKFYNALGCVAVGMYLYVVCSNLYLLMLK